MYHQGSADMLSATYFIYLIQRELDMSDNCFNFNVIEASLNSSFDLKQIKKITDKYNIEYNPKEVDKTIILETEDGDIVGAASTDGNIIKAVVVDDKYQK